jgi:hypothetical protein
VREIRVSPDGNNVAIRSDAADGEWNAWFVGGVPNGGHWGDGTELVDWSTLAGEAN